MDQSFDSRDDDGGEISPEARREFYRQQYLDQGFNDFAADHLSDIPSWEPASARAFFGRSSQIALMNEEYAETCELVRDLSVEVTTRTEVYLFQGLAEGYLMNDFYHTALHQRACKQMKSAVNPKSVFFNESEGLWWPSIAEHFHAVDYTPALESFTQLTYLFAAAHYDPENVRKQFDELVKDEMLFDQASQLWCERKAPSYEDVKFDRRYNGKDQLMGILVKSFIDREEAAADLSRYLSSERLGNEVSAQSIAHKSSLEAHVTNLSQLLLTAAKIFVAEPQNRQRIIQESKDDPAGSFNKETGRWYTLPQREWQIKSSEFAMQRLLSVILNSIAAQYPFTVV